ncbi:hypothetical protein FRB99_000726 [Tulasnella sp. 403]|nr:hypothetical protein FRB99_000726 [Tulasnella sp. 403]
MSEYGRGRGDDTWRRGSSYEPSVASSSSASSRARRQQPPFAVPEQRPSPGDRSRWFPPAAGRPSSSRGGFNRGGAPSGAPGSVSGSAPGFGESSRPPAFQPFRGSSGIPGSSGGHGPPGYRPPGHHRGSSQHYQQGSSSHGSEHPAFFAADQPAILDPRFNDSDQDALIGAFNRLRLRGPFPHRPGWGSSGTAVTLRANHFPITFPRTRFYDYTIRIVPRPSIRRIRTRIFQLLEQAPEFAPFGAHVVHDGGGRLISSRVLPIPPAGLDVVIHHYDEDEDGPSPRSVKYTMNITFNATLNTEDLNSFLSGDPNYRNFDALPIISALNIILSHHPSRTGINVGRNRFFFPDPSTTKPLGSGLEALKGYYSSIRPTFRQLMVNVNSCTTAFYKAGNLADAMLEFLQGGGGRLSGFVRGVRIQTTHLGYRNKKTIKRIGDRTARQQSFICEEYGNASITVEQYFLRKYDIQLQHAADLPVVGVGPSAEKPIWLPAEVCYILPHQPFRGKLPDDATTNMINYACNFPSVNADNIVQQGLRHLGLQTAQPLQEFGISVGTEMAVVPGRILPPPAIMYGRGSVRVDERASWNLREVQFIDPKPLRNWAVLVIRDGGRGDFLGPHDPNLINILNGFTNVCNKSGMTVLSDPAVATVNLPVKDLRADPSRNQAIDAIRGALRSIRPKPNVVLVMLSNGDKHIYTGLKALCDLTLDVHTVCCHSQKIRKEKGQLQFFANIALKINMKLGGVNHTLDHESLQWLLEEPTIMFGSDVTHPSPGSLKGTPSIAAVVASIDDKFAHYPASLRLQESRKEMITDLASIVQERLEQYRATSRRLPRRIVFFRDGVSEGQFLTVTQDELPKIREGCARMSPNGSYRPKITLCIAGKRHHTRFYPVEGAGADRNGNPRPGTVVDRGVTAIYDFDFFLQAHGGLQGTTRPTHYYVVHDENNFNADTLQRLTNATSYMFGRATRAVSLIPPAYYADLACERGRCYIHELLSAGETGSEKSANYTEAEVFSDAERIWGSGVGPNLRRSMFYL